MTKPFCVCCETMQKIHPQRAIIRNELWQLWSLRTLPKIQRYKYQIKYLLSQNRKLKLGHLVYYMFILILFTCVDSDTSLKPQTSHQAIVMILLYDMQAVMGFLGHLQVRPCDTYASTNLELLRKLFPEVVSSLVFWSRIQIMMFFWYIIIHPSYALESGNILLMPNLQSCTLYIVELYMVQPSFGCNCVSKALV